MSRKKVKTEQMQIRCSPKEKAIFEEAADLHEMSLSEWVRFALRVAAQQTVDDHKQLKGE